MKRNRTLEDAWELVPFLRSLSPAARKKLMPYAELKHCPSGQRLWLEGQQANAFCFISKGRAKLVKARENGQETIIEIASSGELACANAVCSFIPYCCSAEPMEDGAVVIMVPRPDLLAVVESENDAARAFVREVISRSIHMCQRVDELSSGRVAQRISMLLLKLADRVGHTKDGTRIEIPVPLSRQDIADLSGTTMESAIRTMSSLRKAKIVETLPGGFAVLNRNWLVAIAEGQSESTGGGITGRSRLEA